MPIAAPPLLSLPLLPPDSVLQIRLPASAQGPSPIRSTPEALVYSACLTDKEWRLLEPLELWVQRLEGKDPAQPLLWAGAGARAVLDQRWEQLFRAFRSTDGARLWVTGWETTTPDEWLCGGVTLNPGGGRFLLRRRAPLSGTDVLRLLSGQALGKAPELAGTAAPFWNEVNELRFGAGTLLSRLGPAARLKETLLLKLQFLGGLMRATRDFTAARQVPLLNLQPASFGVFCQPQGSLPALWTLESTLHDPGIAAAQEITTEESRYFAVVATDHAGIYQSPQVSAPFHARGTVRVRQFKNDAHSKTVTLEGTLTCSERLEGHADDLLRLELLLGTETVLCPARLVSSQGLAAGEARFVTVPLALSEAAKTRLESTWSVAPFENVLFEFIPLLSSPCDLYSFAVIGLELFLTNRTQALPLVLDELLSLARRAAAEKVPGAQLGDWLSDNGALAGHRVLVPQHLWYEPADAALASMIPAALWQGLIAWLMRLLTGQGAFAYCRHPGDAASSSLHAVYQEPIADLEKLIFQARALLLGESEINSEIRDVIGAVIGAR